MAEIVEECPECVPGLPAWMATFADLMSLLMCFFVLLLSFSEMDVLKYKQLAGSMRNAFGVQNEINVRDVPKGTSVIAQEFSPGRPEPTPINEVRQTTTSVTKNTLDIRIDDTGSSDQGEGVAREDRPEVTTPDIDAAKAELVQRLQALIKETQADAQALASSLKKEISTGKIDIETRGRKIILRVREQGSFPSGSAQLRRQFIPVMAQVQGVLKDIPGKISVEGHSDSVPIATATFRSNWDLSSSRALSVAHELFKGNKLDHNRFVVAGFADTKPLVANDTEDSRARNRRVEIVIQQGLDSEASDDLKKLQEIDAGLVRDLNLNTPFTLSPDEVF